jgi:hypothetical protein
VHIICKLTTCFMHCQSQSPNTTTCAGNTADTDTYAAPRATARLRDITRLRARTHPLLHHTDTQAHSRARARARAQSLSYLNECRAESSILPPKYDPRFFFVFSCLKSLPRTAPSTCCAFAPHPNSPNVPSYALSRLPSLPTHSSLLTRRNEFFAVATARAQRGQVIAALVAGEHIARAERVRCAGVQAAKSTGHAVYSSATPPDCARRSHVRAAARASHQPRRSQWRLAPLRRAQHRHLWPRSQ